MDKLNEINAYLAFKEFYFYERNINNFLVHNEFLYQKLQKFDMTFPKRMKAFFFVLNAANLSEENEKLL